MRSKLCIRFYLCRMFFDVLAYCGQKKLWSVFVGLFFLFAPKGETFAQAPVLKFLSDSVQIGEHLKAVLYYRHESDQEIIFPDSNYNFKPFEFVSKQYFPTVTAKDQSLDSVVYTLSIFEIEGTHSLQLPVSVFRGKDTLKLFASADSVVIKPSITVFSDSLKLKSNTQLMELESNFNYVMLILALGLLAILGIVTYLIFGKNIFEQIRKYRRRIAHERFLREYDLIVANVGSLSASKMEEAVSLWKKYIQSLENKPFTTYTSSEIGYHLKNESIKKNLQNIDVAMYSGRAAEVAANDFAVLRQIAIDIYSREASQQDTEQSEQRLKFHGTGRELFSIYMVNLLLTLVTLGIYYPWAKANTKRYIFSNIDFGGSRFAFLGTGVEIFKGYLVSFFILAIMVASVMVAKFVSPVLFQVMLLFVYIIFILLIPCIIHSSIKYSTSRTTWRGIHMGYRGSLKKIFFISIKGTLLTIITLGIYGAWYTRELYSYILSNVRIGSLEIESDSKGKEFFVLNLKGLVFTTLTFGIYYFWYKNALYSFYLDNIKIKQGRRNIQLKSKTTGLGFLKLILKNTMIMIFTVGLGTPWAIVNSLNYFLDHVDFLDEINLDAILQTEMNYKNASGDSLSNLLDIDLV